MVLKFIKVFIKTFKRINANINLLNDPIKTNNAPILNKLPKILAKVPKTANALESDCWVARLSLS